jgi:hypothetical protein
VDFASSEGIYAAKSGKDKWGDLDDEDATKENDKGSISLHTEEEMRHDGATTDEEDDKGEESAKCSTKGKEEGNKGLTSDSSLTSLNRQRRELIGEIGTAKEAFENAKQRLGQAQEIAKGSSDASEKIENWLSPSLS